jgi:hypothetical protein
MPLPHWEAHVPECFVKINDNAAGEDKALNGV